MAEIFGRLRTKEAIPFLVENISMGPGPVRLGDWPLTTSSPAIHALIEIGPDATPSLLQALAKWPRAPDESSLNRLGALIALAYLDDPRAKPALERAAKETGLEGQVAREGLRRLQKKN